MFNAFKDDNYRRDNQSRRRRNRRERFGFSVSVRMIFVGGFERYSQTAPHDERTDDIRARFDAVGDERTRTAENAARYFNRGKRGVDKNSDERRIGYFSFITHKIICYLLI